MQSADLWQGHDGSYFWRLNPSRLGRVLPQREMRSRSVIVGKITVQNSMQGSTIPHHHMVQTFAANGTDQPLHVGILPRRSGRAPYFFRPHAFGHDGKVLTVDRISIAPQVSGYLVPGKRLSQLLHSPLLARVFGHLEVHHTPSPMRQDNEDKQHPEGCRGHRKKVDRGHLPDMIPQEGSPSLGRGSRGCDHMKNIRTESTH